MAILTNRNRAGGPPRATLTLGRIGPRDEYGVFPHRRLFTGIGNFQAPLFSPDGSQVMLGWRDADQWLFFGVEPDAGGSKPLAIGDVARQFAPGKPRSAAVFPRVAGWCCP
jgi:hypothetical protein